MRIVHLKWLDAALETHVNIVTEAKNYKPIHRENVGFLAHEDEEKVVLLFGIVEGAQPTFDQALIVPKGMIYSMTDIGETNLA